MLSDVHIFKVFKPKLFKNFNSMRKLCVLQSGLEHWLFPHNPTAVIFILGFVIYRPERKLNNTAQSHGKWVSDHPLHLF